MVLMQDGSVYAAGENGVGQLGDGSTSDKNFFVKVSSSDAKAIATGDTYSMIVKRDGSLWASGGNRYGQFGNGAPSAYELPPDKLGFVKVVTGGVRAVSAGSTHSIIVKEDGSLWTSGDNEFGQLGDGSTTGSRKFVMVVSKGATAAAAGQWHSVMLQQDGSVWATGRNTRGQLGDGSTINCYSFVKVISSGATAVAAGDVHSIVLMQDGSLWATGANNNGQLGHPRTRATGSVLKQAAVFTKVISSGVKTVSTRSMFSVALKDDGSMWIAGNEPSTHARRAFEVAVFNGVKGVAAGNDYSIMVKQDGTVWASGTNDYGQLGDGSTISTRHGYAFVQGQYQCQGRGSGHVVVEKLYSQQKVPEMLCHSRASPRIIRPHLWILTVSQPRSRTYTTYPILSRFELWCVGMWKFLVTVLIDNGRRLLASRHNVCPQIQTIICVPHLWRVLQQYSRSPLHTLIIPKIPRVGTVLRLPSVASSAKSAAVTTPRERVRT